MCPLRHPDPPGDVHEPLVVLLPGVPAGPTSAAQALIGPERAIVPASSPSHRTLGDSVSYAPLSDGRAGETRETNEPGDLPAAVRRAMIEAFWLDFEWCRSDLTEIERVRRRIPFEFGPEDDWLPDEESRQEVGWVPRPPHAGEGRRGRAACARPGRIFAHIVGAPPSRHRRRVALERVGRVVGVPRGSPRTELRAREPAR